MQLHIAALRSPLMEIVCTSTAQITTQGHAAAGHELLHALALCLCVIKKQ